MRSSDDGLDDSKANVTDLREGFFSRALKHDFLGLAVFKCLRTSDGDEEGDGDPVSRDPVEEESCKESVEVGEELSSKLDSSCWIEGGSVPPISPRKIVMGSDLCKVVAMEVRVSR